MRNAVNGLMKRGNVYGDKFTSHLGPLNVTVYDQSAESFDRHYAAMQLGHVCGHENERTD